MYPKIETEKLNYIRFHQKRLRADNYIQKTPQEGKMLTLNNFGRKIVLPSSYTGSPPYMHERAQDGMTYVRCYGSSDLFITFTCNPKWKEIQESLLSGQKHYHRPDIIARVFFHIVTELKNLLVATQS